MRLEQCQDASRRFGNSDLCFTLIQVKFLDNNASQFGELALLHNKVSIFPLFASVSDWDKSVITYIIA